MLNISDAQHLFSILQQVFDADDLPMIIANILTQVLCSTNFQAILCPPRPSHQNCRKPGLVFSR